MTDNIMLFLESGFKILKVVPTAEQAFFHADLLRPNADYYVNDVNSKGLAAFTYSELQQIHDNHITDYKAVPKWSRDILEAAVLNIIKKIELDETPIFQLRAKLKRDPESPAITPLTAAQRKADLGEQVVGSDFKTRTAALPRSVNMKRPGDTTASGRIWAKCDDILKESGFENVKENVMLWGVDAGINISTVRTQYGHWRRFNNL
jgi:hypothetical protein